MLVPTSKETTYLVVVELNKVKDSEPPSKWCRIHPVMVDFFLNDPIKGQISTMKNKLGFYGVVFIALPVISIPIEGLVCAKFYKHRKEVVPMLVLSVAMWAFLLVTFYEFFIDGLTAYLF